MVCSISHEQVARDMVEALSLETFKIRRDEALGSLSSCKCPHSKTTFESAFQHNAICKSMKCFCFQALHTRVPMPP